MDVSGDETQSVPQAEASESTSSQWTYPTRTCRLCLEEVPATVSLYPPGLPMALQRPHIEYKNDDEYGRLIKPCKCQGSMRYIHELCLRRTRTESRRPGSLWRCHQCGYQFNFKRLTLQKYLGSRPVSGMLTIVVMITFMFLLGFVADPIINLYVDPYETLVGNEDYWQEVKINKWTTERSGWAQHFAKGLVSMGVVSFLRIALLNPFHWWNFRQAGFSGGRVAGRSVSGRDRAVNINMLMIALGLLSAFYLFYQWVQALIGRTLQRIGNNIVDTQLPGDDEDLKPPPDFKVTESYPDIVEQPKPPAAQSGSETTQPTPTPTQAADAYAKSTSFSAERTARPHNDEVEPETVNSGLRARAVPGEWTEGESSGDNSVLESGRSQGWSFDRF